MQAPAVFPVPGESPQGMNMASSSHTSNLARNERLFLILPDQAIRNLPGVEGHNALLQGQRQGGELRNSKI